MPRGATSTSSSRSSRLRGLGYADAYFGLREALEALFERPVELVSLRAVRNPYFLESIAQSRRLLYAA